MLKLSDIKFPITFHSKGVGHFHYTSHNECILYPHGGNGHGNKSTCTIDHMIRCHNDYYEAIKDYSYAMPGYTCFHYKPYKGQVLPVRSPERAEIPMVEMKTCDYKKLWCLSVDNIKYPIVFRTTGKSTIRYTSRDNGVYSDGTKSVLKVDFFVNGHNKFNPHNEEDKAYYVEDITKHLFGETPFGGGKTSIQQIIGEEIHKSAVEMKAPGGRKIDKSDLITIRLKIGGVEYEGAIEKMPLGASIIGIKDDNGDWHDVSFPIKSIEVHDDLICLLAHHGSYKNNPFSAEINIKRGTMVKWKVSA